MSIADKLTEVQENVPKVYEAGKQAEYDAFWDNFQFEGTRTMYNRAFYTWRAAIFKPKYNLMPTRADYMFMDMFPEYAGKGGYSLKKALEDTGVSLDTAQCTNFIYMFYYSYINEVGVIDTRSTSSINAIFSWARELHTIEKLILKDDGSQTLNNAFEAAYKLSNITIDGVLGNSVDFRSCPLTASSLVSIVEHLSDTVANVTATFKQDAINVADWSATDYSSWQELITSKPNWEISLV